MEKKTPINRLNKFFSGEDFSLDIAMGREGLEGDNNITLVLYRVDRTKTPVDNIYGEANVDSIRYLAPVELFVASIVIDETENKAYNTNGTMRYAQNGKLTFKIYSQVLSELDVEITFGDFIGYAMTETTMAYYEVINDGIKNFDNAHSMMGYKGYYRTVVCATVDPNVFSGK